MRFPGFPENIGTQIRIPDLFFRDLLLDMDDLDELKLTLYIFWRFERMEGPFRYLRLTDLLKDNRLVDSMGAGPRKSRQRLVEALQKASQHGSLLEIDLPHMRGRDMLICLNSPRGRAAIEAVRRGDWRLDKDEKPPIGVYSERPNIYQLYENNIGPITPLIADALRDAEKTYQADWIEDALRIAVERNKRNWHYVEAILRNWQEGGRDDRKDQQDRLNTEKAR